MLQEQIIRDRILPDDVKYAQQHLANERTFLAWIRTAISIIGLGFVTTSLHFTIKLSQKQELNNLSIFIGVFSCIIGIIIGILATWLYTKKKKQIQSGIYVPTNHYIIFVSIFTISLMLIIFIYLAFLLLKG